MTKSILVLLVLLFGLPVFAGIKAKYYCSGDAVFGDTFPIGGMGFPAGVYGKTEGFIERGTKENSRILIGYPWDGPSSSTPKLNQGDRSHMIATHYITISSSQTVDLCRVQRSNNSNRKNCTTHPEGFVHVEDYTDGLCLVQVETD